MGIGNDVRPLSLSLATLSPLFAPAYLCLYLFSKDQFNAGNEDGKSELVDEHETR